MKNIWFEGGGYACVWSFGVAEILKENNFDFNMVGGYSAGSMIAMWMLTDSSPEYVFNSIYESPFGPKKGMFKLLKKHEYNLQHMIECILGNPIDVDINSFNNKLWIPITSITPPFRIWRNKFRDYDDLVDCSISSQCIPFVSGKISKCFFNDSINYKTFAIDGGIIGKTPPKSWNKQNTIIVSPWGNGDINMKPSPKITDILFPNYDNLLHYKNIGRSQGLEFLNTYYK